MPDRPGRTRIRDATQVAEHHAIDPGCVLIRGRHDNRGALEWPFTSEKDFARS
jgi:hypothetical protein